MKLSKVLAVALASTMVLGMVSVANADAVSMTVTTDEYGQVVDGWAEDSAFMSALTSDPSSLVITIQYTEATNDGWGDIQFGASIGDGWVSGTCFTTSVGSNTFTITGQEILDDLGCTDASTITYIKTGGYNGIVFDSVTYEIGGSSDGGSESTGAAAPVAAVALVALASAAVVASKKRA